MTKVAPKGEYEGRLQVDDGDLQAGEGPHLGASVYHDVDNDRYMFVQEGDQDHAELHHKRFALMNGTSGPLFDENGKQVFEGDAHHFFPTPDDAHFEDGAKDDNGRITNTRMLVLPDSESETATGHTKAYTGGKRG